MREHPSTAAIETGIVDGIFVMNPVKAVNR
jgi:hypothetical protein